MPQLQYFKDRVDEEDYPSLRKSFRSARMETSVQDYISSAITDSLLIFIASSVGLYLLFFLLIDLRMLYSLPLSIGAGAGIGFACYRLFLYYPKLKATNRESDIEDNLHHAVAYMLALSKGDYKPIQIFKLLSEEKADYGEIAREAGAVYRNSSYLGYSPSKAIQKVAETTPSERLRDFLNSFASIVETGSNITEFLSRRCDRYYEEAEEIQEEDLESLGILSEFYVVGLGLGPLLIVIMLVLFGIMGTLYINLLYMLVYILIPLGTLVFAIILDMQTRASLGGRIPPSELRKAEENSEQSVGANEKTGSAVKEMMNGPSKYFLESPTRILYASIPIAIAAVLSAFYFGYLSLTSTVTFGVLISLTPLSIFYETEKKRRETKVEAMPNFLSSLTSALKSGLSPAKAIKSIPSERLGALSSEIENAKRDMEWGSSVGESIERMILRVRSSVLRRIMRLVRRSSEVVSDLTEILDVLQRDISLEKSMKAERERTTFIYMLIVYITFGVFVLTAFSVSNALVPLMPQVQGAQELGVGGIGVGGIDTATIKTIFFHASLIQGFSTGLLAGKLRSGEILSGLKHSIIMVIIAWLVFTVLII